MFDEKEYRKKYRKENSADIKKQDAEYYKNNKEKIKVRSKRFSNENSDKCLLYKTKNRLKVKYGITLEEYQLLLTETNGICCICKNNLTFIGDKDKKHLAVIDHCHITGKIRGIICRACNAALGVFSDDPEIVKNALEWLNAK